MVRAQFSTALGDPAAFEEHTYLEHAAILYALHSRKRDEALLPLRSHVEISKLEVRKLTIPMVSDTPRQHEA
ncbi:MAG: hypothetical protein ACRYF9_28375 [Janthinobacterium lividum]